MKRLVIGTVLTALVGGMAAVGGAALLPRIVCEAITDGVPVAEVILEKCKDKFGIGRCATSANPTIAGVVPREWALIFEAAAVSVEPNVDPNFLAALYLTENGNRWKPVDSTWPVSSANAKGPMQFLDGTWADYGVDGDGDGVKDVNNPTDAAFAAAKLVASDEYGPTNTTTPVGTISRPWVEGTLLYTAASYNAGPGTIENQTAPEQSLEEPSWGSDGGRQTKNYLRNIDALLNIDPILTNGGHPNYPKKVIDDTNRVHTAMGVGLSATSSAIVWPIDGGPDRITSRFGPRDLNDDPSDGEEDFHRGLDLGADVGTPIYAAAAGTVTQSAVTDPNGYGQLIKIEHNIGGKKVETWYGHMSMRYVAVNDPVKPGQKIAAVGEEGNARGAHLHFEVHSNDGTAIDPEEWLKSNGATSGGTAEGCEGAYGDISGITPPTKNPDGSWPPETCSVRPDPTQKAWSASCVTPRTKILIDMLRAWGINKEEGSPHESMFCYRELQPDEDPSGTQHWLGRACDIVMGVLEHCPTGVYKAEGDRLAQFLVNNADTWAVQYVVWDGKVWSSNRDQPKLPLNRWRVYKEASGCRPGTYARVKHYDHVHVTVR